MFLAFLAEVGPVARTRALAENIFPEEIEVTTKADHTAGRGTVPVFAAVLTDRMLAFLMSSLATCAAGNAAERIIAEVYHHFREDPGILARASQPYYAWAVGISTRAVLHEIIVPGLLAMGLPIALGVLLAGRSNDRSIAPRLDLTPGQARAAGSTPLCRLLAIKRGGRFLTASLFIPKETAINQPALRDHPHPGRAPEL